ncbi:MAG: DUF2723 domain-containing protein [Myxococcales bacterium]|nr:DUF2723 domain-containing protein [Myxococcales bacterium]
MSTRLLLALGAFAGYAFAAAPGLDWLDAGELVAAGATLGISHPPGQPLHALLVAAASMIPFGELAFRATLVSAAAAALAVAAAHALAAVLLPGTGRVLATARLVGAGLVGLSPLLVSQATRAEVYAPVMALAGWATVLAVRFVRGRPALAAAAPVTSSSDALAISALDAPTPATPTRHAPTPATPTRHAHDALLAALLFALATGLQPIVAAALALPAAVAIALTAPRRLARLALPTLALGALGLVVHAYLPLRARAALPPLLVWGDPRDLVSLLDALSGRAYGGNFALTGLGDRLLGHLLLVAEGTGLSLLTLGTAGLLIGAATRLAGALPLLVAVPCILLGVAAQGVFHPANPDVHGYLAPAHLLLSAGVTLLIASAARIARAFAFPDAAALLALLPAIALGALGPEVHVRDHGARRNDAPLRHWDATVGRTPPGPALFIASSDHTLFPALYERLVAGARPDIAVAADALLTSSWFLRMLDRALPELVVPWVDEPGAQALLARLIARNLDAGHVVAAERPLVAAEPRGAMFLLGAARAGEFATAPASYDDELGRRVARHAALIRARFEAARGDTAGMAQALGLVDPIPAGYDPLWLDLPLPPLFISEAWQLDLVRFDLALFVDPGKRPAPSAPSLFRTLRAWRLFSVTDPRASAALDELGATEAERALLALGAVRARAGRFADANAAFSEALRRNPSSRAVARDLATLARQRSGASAAPTR